MFLKVRNLRKRFGGILAMDGCSLDIEGGTLLGLVGPNGSGKSTLFNIVTGIVRPLEGTVELEGQSLLGLRPHEIARRGIGRTFQQTRLFPSLSVLDNVLLGTQAAIERKLLIQARELLSELGLDGLAERKAEALSFGQQRLVELARALICKPRFILLDEPFAGLSPVIAAEVSRHLVSLPERRIGAVLIEHNLPIVMEICPRIAVLHQGRVISVGSPEEIRRDPSVIDAYIGRVDASAT